MLVTWLTLAVGGAAEPVVVWVGPAPPEAPDLAEAAGASRQILPVGHVRAARTRVTARDAEALAALDRAVARARTYEAQLDGELLILELIEPAVRGVGLLRSEADTRALYAALAYQGFAVNRFFGDELATAPAAAAWRVAVAGEVVERPWRDAVALAPERLATPYEIAEAPQRVAYGQRRERILEAPPGLLALPPLPEEALVLVDGRRTNQGSGDVVPVPPGRHLVHVDVNERVVERWDVTVDSGAREALVPVIDQATFERFFAQLAPERPVPRPVAGLLAALDGPVWLATGATEGDVRFYDPSTGSLVPTGSAGESPRGRSAAGVGVEGHLAVVGGWFASDDFYLQDPANQPATFATVNALTVGAVGSIEAALGPVRVGGGLDVIVPLGPAHVAFTGDRVVRVRVAPHLVVGPAFADGEHAVLLTAGVVRPYHPAVGLRGRVGLPGRLELVAQGWYGPGLRRAREAGADWQGSPIFSLTGGLGIR